MGAGKADHAGSYLAASGCAALINYPLWKASAINQSGFIKAHPGGGFRERVATFVTAVAPPYRGVPAVVGGMTWARAMIFYGSDYYRKKLDALGAPSVLSVALPPLVLSSVVQAVNMPIVRASITMQNPANYDKPQFRTTLVALRHLAETKGVLKLWHGLSAGLAKSVPKYITSVAVKDLCEELLPPAHNDRQFLARATVKAVLAGVAGAALTNPMDVVRNEMFKTDRSFLDTVRSLRAAEPRAPSAWMWRGLGSNLIAVSLPISITIFLTDTLIRFQAGGSSANQP